jgi:Tol biopolymer transport system component
LAAHVIQLPSAYSRIFGGGGATMYMESMYLPPVTTGPWAPAWSPDGRSIVVAMRGSLWRVPVEGGEAVQLTEGPHYDSQPDWSPDGTQIAFTRDTGKVIDIWTIEANGSNPRQVTKSTGFAVDPQWSRDGGSILFVSMDQGKSLGLWSVNVADANVRALLNDEYQNISPGWSPDGSRIVFVSNRAWGEKRIQGTGGIWTLRPDTGEVDLLLQEETVYHARPVWSPDGRKVAYASFRGGHHQLWAMSATHGNPQQLTHIEGEVHTPAWSPDSGRIAYISNAGGRFSLWTIPAVGGRPTELKVASRQYRYPVGRVRVVLTDASTKQETQARAYVVAADGKSYTPGDGFHRMVVVTNDHYFHAPGNFEIELPAGPATIELAKGFEYRPVKKQVTVAAGQTSTVEFALERFADLPARGYYSGDNHIHMNYGGIYDATPRSLMLEADGEDLHVVNDVIANQAGTRIHDLKYFEGKLNATSKPNRLMYFNEEFRPGFAGHMALLNIKEFIWPQFPGNQGTATAAHYPPNSHVLDQVHKQGGVAGYVHPFTTPKRDPEEYDYSGAREFPVNAALGNVDYYDVMCIWSDEYVSAQVWYRVLNLGFRVPASAGTDAMTNYWRAPAIGTTRVYVRSGPKLEYEQWIKGLTAGRSFVTNGPLLFMRVDAKEPGDEIQLPGGGTSVRVEVEAQSIVPMDTLDIVQNGKVVRSVKLTDPFNVTFDERIPVERSGWIAARVTGPERQRLLMDSYVYAHTNPVYLIKNGAKSASPEDARYFLRWIDRVLVLLEQSDAFDNPTQKKEVIDLWRRARVVYAGLSS